MVDNNDVREDDDDLALNFETMAKRKKAEDPAARRQSNMIKQESL